jgi:glycosyltransferase involved in cell wall biosynthesis
VKVAFVSFDYPEYTFRIANGLAGHCDVLLVQPRQHIAPFLPASSGVTVWTFAKPRLRQPGRQARVIAAILRRIHEFRPDVVHVQSGHAWFHLALPLLRRYPLVMTIHDVLRHVGDRESRKTPQWIADFGHRAADHVIVHTERMRQLALTRLRVPAAHVHIVPHVALGPGTSVIPPGYGEEERGLILFFGRIWGYKGLEYLISAQPAITAAVPDARIVIAGTGENFDRYRSMMRDPDRFIVINEFVSDSRRDELFRRAAVVVLPYIEASQTGVIPLAYTFGKPVVGTTVGGLPDMIEHGRTGYLVPPRDVSGLASAIVTLLQDDELRHRFGSNGRFLAEHAWSPSTVAAQTMEVYRAAGRATARRRLFRKAAVL